MATQSPQLSTIGRRPVRVFLDSADYSVLSDPKRCTGGLFDLKDRLTQWADSGDVEFWYSGTILSEMAPLEAQYADASVSRTEMLVRLCKRQAVISFERLLNVELSRLQEKSAECYVSEIHSYDGNWFPELTDVVSPITWLEGIRQLDASAKEHGLNREARRRLRRRLFKEGQPTEAMRSFLDSQQGTLNEIFELYPMREQDAAVLAKYVAGRATAQEAENAFLESLRDPRWMLRWFHNHHDGLTPFSEWVRGPSKAVVEAIQKAGHDAATLKAKCEQLRAFSTELGIQSEAPRINAAAWLLQQEEVLTRVAQALIARMHGNSTDTFTAEAIDRLAPGLATCVRVLHSSAWNSVGETARNPKESDWVDSLHSMYAPYVDIFRTDSYMAPIVQSKSERYGTVVVAKLGKLAEQIEARLNAVSNPL